MSEDADPKNLEEMLERLCAVEAESDRVSLDALLEAVGRRSFGPLLLLLGLMAASPLSGVPGVPSTVGIMVLVVTAQLLLARPYFWMPRWILRRTVARSTLERAVSFLRRPARFIDRLVRPRLTILTRSPALYAIGALCLLIGATMPPLELLPFAATIAGIALAAFGLAIIAQDGVLVLVALLFTGGSAVVIATSVL